jgi:hypothetical protein
MAHEDQVPKGKNGICSAHPLLIQELHDINLKLDNLTTEDLKKRTINEIWEPWKNRIIGALSMLAVYVIFEIIKYFTPL